MKRFILILVLTSLLAGCGALPDSFSFFSSPTPTHTPAPTATPFKMPATFTPDLFVINTEQPTSTAMPGASAPPDVTDTARPLPTTTARSTITLEPLDPFLFTPSPAIFINTQRSTSQLVWGYNCDGSRSIRFTTNVKKVKRLKYVLLFVRLQDKYSARHTEWGAGAIMSDNDQGVYFYTLDVDQIADYESYQDAWVQYQFVASTVGLTVLGRSVVSRNEISLTHCSIFNP